MISVSKKAYIITIIFLIVVILGLGGYIVYDKFFDVKENDIKENQGSLEDVRKKQEENNNTKGIDSELIGLKMKYIESVSPVLYPYLESNEKDLINYLKSLDNNKKLFLGNVGDRVTWNQILLNLKVMFNSDLEVQKKDYYLIFSKDSNPLYKIYDDGEMYYYNSDTVGQGYSIDNQIYNYKEIESVTNNDNYEVTYYALIHSGDIGPGDYYDKNGTLIDIEHFGKEGQFDFDAYFETNKDNFYQIKYSFDKENYTLVNIERMN